MRRAVSFIFSFFCFIYSFFFEKPNVSNSTSECLRSEKFTVAGNQGELCNLINIRARAFKVSSDTIIGQGATLNFKLLKMKLHRASQSSVTGTYRSSFDVKPISSMTSEDFSEVYWYSCLQALFVTVLQTSVNFVCKNSCKNSFLLGYFDCFLSNHTVGCCNIGFSSLSSKRRENFCFPSISLTFSCTFLRDCSCFDATLGQFFTLRPPNFLF